MFVLNTWETKIDIQHGAPKEKMISFVMNERRQMNVINDYDLSKQMSEMRIYALWFKLKLKTKWSISFFMLVIKHFIYSDFFFLIPRPSPSSLFSSRDENMELNVLDLLRFICILALCRRALYAILNDF